MFIPSVFVEYCYWREVHRTAPVRSREPRREATDHLHVDLPAPCAGRDMCSTQARGVVSKSNISRKCVKNELKKNGPEF